MSTLVENKVTKKDLTLLEKQTEKSKEELKELEKQTEKSKEQTEKSKEQTEKSKEQTEKSKEELKELEEKLNIFAKNKTDGLGENNEPNQGIEDLKSELTTNDFKCGKYDSIMNVLESFEPILGSDILKKNDLKELRNWAGRFLKEVENEFTKKFKEKFEGKGNEGKCSCVKKFFQTLTQVSPQQS